jgi:RNA polymerase sigma-70 factor (ECF subfamily)
LVHEVVELVSSHPLDTALRGARAGDEAAFLLLWQAMQPRLLRYLRLRAGSGYEDVAAETWLQVVRDLRTFRGDATDFRRWLFTLARNRAIDAARAQSVRPQVLVGDVTQVDSSSRAPSAEDEAMTRLSTDDALARLATLPAEQAEMVALRVLGGLDVTDVADIVGKSPGAVRVAVHRALRSLSGQIRTENAEVM